jgi:hypothetical protein
MCMSVCCLLSMQVAARCNSAIDRDYCSITIDAATSSAVLMTVAYSPTLLILRPTNESSRMYRYCSCVCTTDCILFMRSCISVPSSLALLCIRQAVQM